MALATVASALAAASMRWPALAKNSANENGGGPCGLRSRLPSGATRERERERSFFWPCPSCPSCPHRVLLLALETLTLISQFFEALDASGIDNRTLRLPNDPHHPRRPSNSSLTFRTASGPDGRPTQAPHQPRVLQGRALPALLGVDHGSHLDKLRKQPSAPSMALPAVLTGSCLAQ